MIHIAAVFVPPIQGISLLEQFKQAPTTAWQCVVSYMHTDKNVAITAAMNYAKAYPQDKVYVGTLEFKAEMPVTKFDLLPL